MLEIWEMGVGRCIKSKTFRPNDKMIYVNEKCSLYFIFALCASFILKRYSAYLTTINKYSANANPIEIEAHKIMEIQKIQKFDDFLFLFVFLFYVSRSLDDNNSFLCCVNRIFSLSFLYSLL